MARTSARGRENLVRRHRRSHELTQVQLAEMVGVTRQTIVALESGDYAPSVYLALGLAEALGVTVEELFGTREGHVNDGEGKPSHASTNGSVR